MAAMNFIDTSIHGASFPATYVAPGVLQFFGVSGTPGSTTGTLPTTPPSGVYGGNTYTLLAANIMMTSSIDAITGYFTGNGALTVIPVGFAPTKVVVMNWTDGVEWTWMLGAPATDSAKLTNVPTFGVDTTSAIVVTADAAGGLGDTAYVALSAAMAITAKVFTFRIDG